MALVLQLHLRRAPALVQCWTTRWLLSHSVPCCGVLTPRCSVTPPSVSTTRLPRCVDRRASTLQMPSVSFSGNQLRQHRGIHRSSRGSLRSAAGTPTRHVACGASIRRVKSARVAFLDARVHSLHAKGMSYQSNARYASLACLCKVQRQRRMLSSIRHILLGR